MNECIQKKVVTFIEKYHSYGDCVFLPDLVTSHCAKTVVNYAKLKNFVKKEYYPANMSEIYLIEDLCGILKCKLYQNGLQDRNLNQLRNRLKYFLGKLNHNIIYNLCR